jgi:hypothetical protein
MEGSNINAIVSNATDKISNTLYVNFRSIELTDVFMYGVIVCIVLYLTSYLKLNIYLVLIFTFVLIFMDISKKYVYKTVKKDHLEDELNGIIPHPVNIDKYPDIINLFHGLKPLAELNFVEFSSVVYNTDAVIGIYNDVLIGTKYCKQNYDVARDRAIDALNALHNLVYGIPVNQTVSENYHNSLTILHQILNTFLDKIKRTCEQHRKKTGWNNDTQIIFPGPLPISESFQKVGDLDAKLINVNNDYY